MDRRIHARAIHAIHCLHYYSIYVVEQVAMAMATVSLANLQFQNSVQLGSLGLNSLPRTVLPKSRKHYGILRVESAARFKSPELTREVVLKEFDGRRALKVISGLDNFDAAKVSAVVIAAEKGGATHVDIACDSDLVKVAAGLTTLPICVSGIQPEALLKAVQAGADMVEIGNFDSFYKVGRVFSFNEVLDLSRRTRELLPQTVLSVTIPHTMPLEEQVRLAEILEVEGVDIIQTEGGTSSLPLNSGVHGLIEKAVPTLAAAYSISKAVAIPIMCASGLSAVTAPMAIASGASGVGIGSAVNKLNDQVAMIAAVRAIADSLGLPQRDWVEQPVLAASLLSV